MEPIKSNHSKRLITLTMITLSGFHCSIFYHVGSILSEFRLVDELSKLLSLDGGDESVIGAVHSGANLLS
jgi:hypothetical protein